jgi:hypothetical protein
MSDGELESDGSRRASENGAVADSEARLRWYEELRRQRWAEFLEYVKDSERRLAEIRSKKGILERLFGYRTNY